MRSQRYRVHEFLYESEFWKDVDSRLGPSRGSVSRRNLLVDRMAYWESSKSPQCDHVHSSGMFCGRLTLISCFKSSVQGDRYAPVANLLAFIEPSFAAFVYIALLCLSFRWHPSKKSRRALIDCHPDQIMCEPCVEPFPIP